jgi:levanase/fructan beta-fructosidase
MSLSNNEQQANEQRAELYKESLRPQYHFTARYWNDYRLNPQQHQEGWVNDVNGLVYFDGEYHFFAQRWWSCWLHAVSTDLLHWKELEPAFGAGGRFGGTQSGGGIVDYTNASGLGTGIEPVMIAFWSSTDNESQCISYSNDRGRTWVKYAGNPVLVHPHRDPNVFWYEPEQKWIMILYGPPDNSYVLFSSTNLLNWKKLSVIPDMYECPDMFPLLLDGDKAHEKWIVVDGNGDYVVGRFDGQRFESDTAKMKSDCGRNFYASMTFDGMPKEDDRRIQMAWMRGGDYPDMPFNQQITFPCELTLRTFPEGIRMCRYPVSEIEKLQTSDFVLNNRTLAPGENPLAGIKGELFDIAAEVDLSKSDCDEIVFNVRGNIVKYNLRDKQLDSCGTCAELLPRSGMLQLRILVDRMSVESFGNHGEISMTNIAQAHDTEPALSLHTIGGDVVIKSLAVHELSSIWQSASVEPAGAADVIPRA